jgi:hypothetical protein
MADKAQEEQQAAIQAAKIQPPNPQQSLPPSPYYPQTSQQVPNNPPGAYPAYPPAYVAPMYPTSQPGYGYDQTPSHQPSAPSTPHAQTIIIGQPGSIYQQGYRESFTGQIVLSCVTTWLCCWILGLIAFCLALTAQSSASAGNATEARKFGRASYILSIIGIIVGIVLLIFAVVYVMTTTKVHSSYSSSSPSPYNNLYG